MRGVITYYDFEWEEEVIELFTKQSEYNVRMMLMRMQVARGK